MDDHGKGLRTKAIRVKLRCVREKRVVTLCSYHFSNILYTYLAEHSSSLGRATKKQGRLEALQVTDEGLVPRLNSQAPALV